MCRVLGVSRSGLHAWRQRLRISARRASDDRLLITIRKIHSESRGTYGTPRIHAELRCDGTRVGRKRVERLMRENAIEARIRRPFRTTTDSDHDRPVAPNLLDRQFVSVRPNQVWATDITYVWTQEGWLYLAVVLDLFSRRIVGWSMAEHMRTDLVSTALVMALGNRLPKGELLHHSDRGSQYASFAYQKLLEQNSINVSMSRRAECYDNAVVESFFGTLKTELVYRSTWPTRDSVRSAIQEYIEVFYNRRRRHSRLGHVSPAEFEGNFNAAPAA
jgi:transposase InsO family protein